MILILGVKLIHLYTLYINIKNIKIYRTYIPFTRQHKNENYREVNHYHLEAINIEKKKDGSPLKTLVPLKTSH